LFLVSFFIILIFGDTLISIDIL